MTDRKEAGALPLAVGTRTRGGSLRRMFVMRWLKRDAILSEILEIRGLMPLLMKHRNGARWTLDEKLLLRHQLRALIHFIPWLVILLLPGSALLIPLLAWWLDRRRQGRRDGAG